MQRIIIAGCGFAGYTAALELKRRLGEQCDVLVISKHSLYVYTPALPAIPFGLRQPDQISFDVRTVLARNGIRFSTERVVTIDAQNNSLETSEARYSYDYLLIAVGPAAERMRPWGLDSAHTSWSIVTLDDAMRTRQAWQRFLLSPGPMVIGAVMGAPLYAAHYQFVLNAVHELDARGIRNRVPIRFLTPEPELGQFGSAGAIDSEHLAERLFAHHGIEWSTGVDIREVRDDRVVLQTGEEIATSFTMLMPRFIGPDVIRASRGIGNQQGLVEVDDACRHNSFGNIFAAGLATTFRWNEATIVSGGLPMTIYPAERMALTAAFNIAASIHGNPLARIPLEDLARRSAHDAAQSLRGTIDGALPQQRSRELLQSGAQAQQNRMRYEQEFLEARSSGTIG